LTIPLIYVIIQLFIAYSIIVTVTQEDDTDKIITIFFTFYFTFFLVLGQSFTAGLYAFVPMTEKKGGLRQMMHMSGLSSFQYFLGLWLGDMTLFFGPAVVLSLALLGFPEIMVQDQVFNFFVSYMFYGMALTNFTYLCAHLFDNPDTGTKYIALICVLGLIFGPVAISLIFAAIFGFSSSVGNAISVWYFINPTLSFGI